MNTCRPDGYPPYDEKPKPEPRREPIWVERAKASKLPVKVYR